MKNKGIFICYLLVLFVPLAALAHETKVDRDISVFIHISPDDQPVANEPASILLLITDAKNIFSGEVCDCKIVVSDHNKIILSQSFVVEGGGALIPYVFPHGGIYQVQVSGEPKGKPSFQSFNLTFDKRVEVGNVPRRIYPKKIVVLISGSVLLLLGWVLYKRKYT